MGERFEKRYEGLNNPVNLPFDQKLPPEPDYETMVVPVILPNGQRAIIIDDLKQVRNYRSLARHNPRTEPAYRQEGEMAILDYLIALDKD